MIHRLRKIVNKNRQRIIAFIQLFICVVCSAAVISKDSKQRLKLLAKKNEKSIKANDKLKKRMMKDAAKIVKAEYKFKMAKLKAKAKADKQMGKLVIKKIKQKSKARNR